MRNSREAQPLTRRAAAAGYLDLVLDVRRLRVLREVARRGSLAAAADVLSYTPSAVSQQIAVLEREAGTRLLERRARGVVSGREMRLNRNCAQRVAQLV